LGNILLQKLLDHDLGNSDEDKTGAGRTRLNPQRLGLPKLRVRGQGGMFGTSTLKTAFGTIYVGQNEDSVLESRIKYGIVIPSFRFALNLMIVSRKLVSAAGRDPQTDLALLPLQASARARETRTLATVCCPS